jgi:hypothetical protein
MDEDDEGMADDGRQLTVLGNEEPEEPAELSEEEIHQLTVVDIVRLTEDQLTTIRSDLLVTRAKDLIEQAAKADEILKINDWSARYRLLAEQAEDRTMEAAAVEIRERARRRLGQMMKASEKAKGGRTYHTGSGADPVHRPPTIAPTLAEYGIKKRLAHESRQLARIPDDEWERHVSKITGKILNPPPKPKSPKLEDVAETGEGMNLGLLTIIMSHACKDILNHKALRSTPRRIIRAELAKLRDVNDAMADAIEEVWDDLEEEGVVDAKSSTLNLEGL